MQKEGESLFQAKGYKKWLNKKKCVSLQMFSERGMRVQEIENNADMA